MICWIASYPKSGNTWLRSLLSDYIYFSQEYAFENLKKIDQFPTKKYFYYLFDEKKINIDTNFKDLNVASKYWIDSQKRIVAKFKEDVLLKTHGCPVEINKNYFISDETTKAAICLVRDPREVIISLQNHYNYNLSEAFEMMTTNSFLRVPNEDGIDDFFSYTLCPAWNIFYNSWKNCKTIFPIIFVKYEEMYNIDTFKKILKFLNNHLNIPNLNYDETKANIVFERSRFENLKKIENEKGFFERSKTAKSNFFNSGKINTWKNKIDRQLRKKIEEHFFDLMREFEYI